MKKIYLFLLLVVLCGCAVLKKPDSARTKESLYVYSGPKARIAVQDFEVKAAKATMEISGALREILVSALVNSKRFSSVERSSADLIIAAAIAEFEPQASGGSSGVGGGGGVASGMLGGLLGAKVNKAHIALDIRVTDTATSQVLTSARVQGQASDITAGRMTDIFGENSLPGALSAYKNTPMAKAIRICILEAVRLAVQNVPEQYYKN